MPDIYEVVSPIPGTYYSKESPGTPPFVTVGSTIGVGDTVGLVEVMKMFHPVLAEMPGTVVEICVETEDPVDIGDVLIRVQTS